ncbi:hypothetical protein [Kaistia sp. MMO-174]|uniref:hypothetical protein n=1 Tax=Kaistia sp. MMO-174 TaxID=3081256 RepID=UPI003018F965
MRILVCGGRNYGRVKGNTSKADRPAAEALAAQQRERVEQVLAAAVERLGMREIIADNGTGAVACAQAWSDRKGFPMGLYEMDTARYGKTAEPLNHDRMIREGKPDAVIVFPGKWETEDVIEKATAAGIRVIEIDRKLQSKGSHLDGRGL